MKSTKTNASRILDAHKIHHELISYPIDDEDFSALHVATILNEPIEKVFKTLVLEGDKTKYFVCVVPGDEEIDLKKAAKISDNKRCNLIPMKLVLPLTGYLRGGCSPIGMKKNYQTFIHQSIIQQEFIYISAGLRGLQIKMNPKDLISITNGVVCELI